MINKIKKYNALRYLDIHFNWNFSRGGLAILNQELNLLDLTLQNEIKDLT